MSVCLKPANNILRYRVEAVGGTSEVVSGNAFPSRTHSGNPFGRTLHGRQTWLPRVYRLNRRFLGFPIHPPPSRGLTSHLVAAFSPLERVDKGRLPDVRVTDHPHSDCCLEVQAAAVVFEDAHQRLGAHRAGAVEHSIGRLVSRAL